MDRAAGRGHDVVLDRYRRLRVAGLHDADPDEALAGQAEPVTQLVADDLRAGAARVGLVADRRRPEAEHAAELEVDGLAVLPHDAADEGEVTVRVDPARRHGDEIVSPAVTLAEKLRAVGGSLGRLTGSGQRVDRSPGCGR